MAKLEIADQSEVYPQLDGLDLQQVSRIRAMYGSDPYDPLRDRGISVPHGLPHLQLTEGCGGDHCKPIIFRRLNYWLYEWLCFGG